MSKLAGMHDREGMALVPPGGFCLDTVALLEGAQPTDYKSLRDDINWIVRLNWAYGSAGTYPAALGLDKYLSMAVDYILQSRGIYGYIPGNEPNHAQERPGGNVLSPKYTAQVFTSVRNAVRPFNHECLAITTPVAPYHASPMDWLVYLKEYLTLVANQGGADGIGIHAYVRGGTHLGVYSLAKMGPPLTGQSNSFRTYRDALGIVPSSMRKLPAFITETNPVPVNDSDPLFNLGWYDINNGVVRAIYDEIDAWNSDVGTQKVHCVCLYRYPTYDKWAIEGKNGVIEDYKMAVAKGYSADKGGTILLPDIKNDPPPSPKPVEIDRFIDPEATARGVKVVEASPVFGKPVWKAKLIDWLNEKESRGLHHILLDARSEEDDRVVGVPIEVRWPSDAVVVFTQPKPGEETSADFPMSPSRNEFSVKIVDGNPSDEVVGIGMGMETSGGYNAGIHTSTRVIFQRISSVSPPKPVQPPVRSTIPPLAHPVADPDYRRITQVFGVNEAYYKQFKPGGVALKGHNGIDFGTPIGSNILAAASGTVVEVFEDTTGFGKYVKIIHPWGETLYAHLSDWAVDVGDEVKAGRMVGWSGNTGKSTGPHLHFGMRINPYNRADGWGGYSDPLPYLTASGQPQKPEKPSGDTIPEILLDVAEESGLEYELLASLAWAESSFNPALEDGLFQIGDQAWSDFAPKVGATDINNPLDNSRVAAAYLKWLLNRYDNDLWKALYAYNWGASRVDAGGKPPVLTQIYANKVIHGRDLLKVVGNG